MSPAWPHAKRGLHNMSTNIPDTNLSASTRHNKHFRIHARLCLRLSPFYGMAHFCITLMYLACSPALGSPQGFRFGESRILVRLPSARQLILYSCLLVNVFCQDYRRAVVVVGRDAGEQSRKIRQSRKIIVIIAGSNLL